MEWLDLTKDAGSWGGGGKGKARSERMDRISGTAASSPVVGGIGGGEAADTGAQSAGPRDSVPSVVPIGTSVS